jgi:signal peptidase II
MIRWLILAVLLVGLDQATKQWAVAVLDLHRPIPVLPGLNFMLTYNPGAAFSFLSDAGGWQRWFFIGLTLVVLAVLLRWLNRETSNRPLALALSLVIGGAVGNLLDRIYQGAVVDFIDVYYHHWHWPAFNLADSAISLGVALLLLEQFGLWRGGQKENQNH